MKKFTSFCVAIAIAACAVPAMAQCSSCGGSPAFSQPVTTSSYIPQATYAAPVMSAPVYSAPVMSQPIMSSQIISAPMVSAPMMSSQIISSPVISSGCSSCGGGTVVSGTVMSSPVISSGMVSNTIIESAPMTMSNLPPGARIISWEGGSQIQGTVVSDVLIKTDGEAAAGSDEAESTVDVVEPPAAAAEKDAPGPDTEEEEKEDKTEGET